MRGAVVTVDSERRGVVPVAGIWTKKESKK